MKHSKKELDAIIDDGIRSIRDEHIDPSSLDESSMRVWARVAEQSNAHSPSAISNLEGINAMNPGNTAEHIRGCEDFQSLIPAYLKGELSQARTLLLEDHSNECIPCRRELKAQRDGVRANVPATVSTDRRRRWSFTPAMRWSMAAAVVLSLGFAGLFVYERLDLSGRTLAATIESADGSVYVVSDSDSRSLAAGEQLQKGEHVRTAKDSTAVLRLADGSTVEMRERSEFSVTENMRGVTMRLERGDVIVEAAKQHNGRLYVQTPDSLVSVKGTIFAVESGTKGSRVSVVEGEVEVSHGRQDETLLPGDQATTNPSLEKTPVQQNVAWSRNAARYASLVSQLAKLRSDVNRQVARPGVRYSSKFLDLVPENTVFYAALPNLSESLAESQRLMQERIRQNPELAKWWKGNHGDGAGINEQAMTRIHEFGSQLGEEIVVAAEMDPKGEPRGVLVLGDVKDANNFRSYIEGQKGRFAKDAGGGLNVRVVDDPMTAKAEIDPGSAKDGSRKSELFVWIHENIFAASPQVESLRKFQSTVNAPGTNGFANSPFYQRISDVYREGAGLVVAADLERVVAQAISRDTAPDAARRVEGLKQLGVTNLRHFVVEQKEQNGRTLSRAALTFAESHRGIASWLAAPGSMGALDFISPNANVATAFVVKEPALLADDLLGFLETVQPELRNQMREIERSQGLDLRNDFAAPLGGEFAFAIDGPVLPTPSWKIILEVYDQTRLQGTFEKAIDRLNQFSMLHGKGKLSLERTTVGERTYYAVRSTDVGVEVHYTYANGYLVAGPSRALLEQTISNRDAGNTLVRSARFMSSLPSDGNTNFSAIFYHDLAPLVKSLGDRLKSSDGTTPMIDVNAPPTLAYAYAQGDRITIAANTEGGAFGLSPASLIGLPNSFQMQHILMNAMGDKDVQKKE